MDELPVSDDQHQHRTQTIVSFLRLHPVTHVLHNITLIFHLKNSSKHIKFNVGEIFFTSYCSTNLFFASAAENVIPSTWSSFIPALSRVMTPWRPRLISAEGEPAWLSLLTPYAALKGNKGPMGSNYGGADAKWECSESLCTRTQIELSISRERCCIAEKSGMEKVWPYKPFRPLPWHEDTGNHRRIFCPLMLLLFVSSVQMFGDTSIYVFYIHICNVQLNMNKTCNYLMVAFVISDAVSKYRC